MKKNIHIITQEFFRTSFFTYIVLILAETLKIGLVSSFFDLNYLLTFILVCGTLAILTEGKVNKISIRYTTFSDWLDVVFLSVGGGILVFLRTQALGTLAKPLCIVTGILIFLVTSVVLLEGTAQAKAKTLEILGKKTGFPKEILRFLIQMDEVDRLTFLHLLQNIAQLQKKAS